MTAETRVLKRIRYLGSALWCLLALAPAGAALATSTSTPPSLHFADPALQTRYGDAYRKALKNLLHINTVPADARHRQSGLLRGEPVMMIRAGGGYHEAWTRDASINTWNAASLIAPALARNTLWSVVRRRPDGHLIVQQDNQWWDQVIWITAAWQYYLASGNRDFLRRAYPVAIATLDARRKANFDAHRGLFRGPAFFNDGISGYPTPPANAREAHGSFVLDYPAAHHIEVLSTNVLYAAAYRNAARMAKALGKTGSQQAMLQHRATALAQRINTYFWIPDAGRYGYLLQPDGTLDTHQEGAGLALAIVLGVADHDRAASIMRHAYIARWGMPDIYPSFARYNDTHPGRHNLIVWPLVQGLWADAAAQTGNTGAFVTQMRDLAELAQRSHGFWEIYNADSGAVDGGWQVARHWPSQPHQTWSATAYLHMIYRDLFGITPTVDGLCLQPLLPPGWGSVSLRHLHYHGADLSVRLHGTGRHIAELRMDGQPASPRLSADIHGSHRIDITLSPADTRHTVASCRP